MKNPTFKKYLPAILLFVAAIVFAILPSAVDAVTTLQEAINGKTSTTTYNAGVGTINTNLTSINSVMAEISANLYGTSTSMSVGAASTTQGLLNKADYAKVQAMSTSTITTVIQTALNAKQNTIATGTASQYFKGDLTLGNTPVLAAVATTGAYSSLTGLPTIPAAQIQSDYTQASTTALDFIKNKPTRTWATSTRSIVTTAAAANGFQLSATKDAQVGYSVTIVSTATISGNASGYVVLELAATNSSTASDWSEVGRISNGQSVSLAITLQAVSTGGGQITAYVPAGYYARLRSVNTAGTPTYTFNSGQEVLLK